MLATGAEESVGAESVGAESVGAGGAPVASEGFARAETDGGSGTSFTDMEFGRSARTKICPSSANFTLAKSSVTTSGFVFSDACGGQISSFTDVFFVFFFPTAHESPDLWVEGGTPGGVWVHCLASALIPSASKNLPSVAFLPAPAALKG